MATRTLPFLQMDEEKKRRLLAYLNLFVFVVYLAAQKVFQAFQKIYRVWTGLSEIPEGQVRVQSILYKKKRDPEEISRVEDFVLVHNQFADVNLLDDDTWTLYALDQDFAYFVLLPHPVTYYNSHRYPFVYLGLLDHALLVASVPRQTFLEFASLLASREQPRTVFFTNTARSGSTLLARMLHHEGKTVVFAEPYPLAILSIGYHEGYFSKRDVEELLPAVITSLRAGVPKDLVCILKGTSTESRLVPFCKDIPNLKHIFLFRRHGRDSVEKMMRRETITDVLYALYVKCPWMSNLLGWVIACEGRLMRRLKPDNWKKLAAIVYAAPYADYLKNAESYSHPLIWFHDIIEKTEETLRALFHHIDIPEECVEAGVACKAVDSQAGSFLSSSLLTHIDIRPLSDEDRRALRVYAREMGVPEEVLLGDSD